MITLYSSSAETRNKFVFCFTLYYFFPGDKVTITSLCTENFMLLNLILIFIWWRSYCLCCRLEEFLSVRRDCGRLVGRWETQNCTITGDTSRSTHSLPLPCNRDRRIVDGQFGFSVLVWTLPSFILGQRDQSIVLL